MSDPTSRLNDTGVTTEYPYVQTLQLEGGHQLVFGNRPGNRFIRLAHGKSGSYIEMSENGKMVTHVTGNQQTMNKGGVTLTVEENNDVKIHGHNRVITDGGSHIEVKGDASIATGGQVALLSMGGLNVGVVGDVYLGSTENLKMNVGGNMDMQIKGNQIMNIGGSQTTTVGGTVVTQSDGNNTTLAPRIDHN